MPGHDETQVIELPDSRLMAFSRMEGQNDAGLLLSESDDKGLTWVRTWKLLQPNQWPFGIALSDDLGQTWPDANRVLLGWDSLDIDTGYPSTVQLADGTMLATPFLPIRLGIFE